MTWNIEPRDLEKLRTVVRHLDSAVFEMQQRTLFQGHQFSACVFLRQSADLLLTLRGCYRAPELLCDMEERVVRAVSHLNDGEARVGVNIVLDVVRGVRGDAIKLVRQGEAQQEKRAEEHAARCGRGFQALIENWRNSQ